MKNPLSSKTTSVIMLFTALMFFDYGLHAQSLVGHWLTGDGSLADESGYQPAGTHDAFADGNPADFSWTNDVPPGFIGMSANLTPGDVGLRIANSMAGDGNYQTTFDDNLANAFSVMFWARGFPGVWNPFVAKGGDNGALGYQVRRYADTSFETFTIRGMSGVNGNPNAEDANGSTKISDGKWHHFAAIWDGVAGTRKFYVDGVLDPNINFTNDFGPMPNPNANPLGLGERYTGGAGSSPGNFLSGILYDVRVYNYAVSTNTIVTVMTPTASFTTINPVALTLSQGVTNQLTVGVTLAPSANTNQAYTVYVTNSAPAVLNLVGSVNGVLTLTFPAGNLASQSVLVSGLSAGAGTVAIGGPGLQSSSAIVTILPVVPPALVGHWLSGADSLTDTSGYQPAGTHDGVPDAANTGTIAYSPDVPTGFTGDSLDLTSLNSAVRINNTRTNDAAYTNTFDSLLANHFSVTLWEKEPAPDYAPGYWATFVAKNGESTGFMVRILSTSDNETFTLADNHASANPGGSVDVNDGNWHYIASVWDGVAGVRKVYVDGVLDIYLTGDFGPMINPQQYSLMFGARDNGSVGNYSDGLLYDVRIYNYTLSEAEAISIGTPPGPPTVSNPANQTIYTGFNAHFSVAATGNPLATVQWYFNGTNKIAGGTNTTLTVSDVQSTNVGNYTAQVANSLGTNVSTAASLTLVGLPTSSSYASMVLANSPMGYWRFNDGNGTVANDYAGGYDAYDPLGSSLQAGPVPPAFPGFESTNTAPFLDGLSQGYTSSVSLFNNLTNFTIMGWFNINPNQYPFTAPDGRASLFGQEYAAELGFYGTSNLYFYSTGLTGAVITDTGFTPGQWTFVAAVSDTAANTTTLYLNGQSVGTPLAASTGAYNNYLFSIGKNVADKPSPGVDIAFFPGSLDEVAAFDHALSPATILALYQTAIGTITAPFKISIASQAGHLQVTWPAGHLEAATSLTGPWTAVSGAVSPYTVPQTNSRTFYRAANP
jgi:hypothetical protein